MGGAFSGLASALVVLRAVGIEGGKSGAKEGARLGLQICCSFLLIGTINMKNLFYDRP